MDTRTNRHTNSAPYAVIRCYLPTRIERELLAQVFDLVGRGRGPVNDPAYRGHQRIALSSIEHSNVRRSGSVLDMGSQPRAGIREDAA